MDIDPLDIVEPDEDPSDNNKSLDQEKRKSRLNTAVAISVALLATFIGICKIKDDNIVQGMQQAQANRIDDWALYQARNIRAEIAKSTVTQLQLQALSQPATTKSAYQKQIDAYQSLSTKEEQKKEQQKTIAETDQQTYDQLNFHDDQFDLSDAALSLAISLLAITSLSQKRWLFAIAMIPTAFGVVMGLSGLFGWNLHPDALIKPLTQQAQPATWQLARQELIHNTEAARRFS
ncbi:MAG: DUF4337 domain-containing protein [Leptolyngbya sp. BL-A-14]